MLLCVRGMRRHKGRAASLCTAAVGLLLRRICLHMHVVQLVLMLAD
jgi:hypothetical protein